MKTDITTKEAGRYTVGRLFAERAFEDPDRPFLLYPDVQKSRTYGQINAACDGVARAIIALIGDKSSHAALWAPNVPRYLPVQVGCARAGIPLVLVNTNLKGADLEYVLVQSDTRVLFLTGTSDNPESLVSIFKELCPDSGDERGGHRFISSRFPKLEYVIFLGPGEYPGLMSFDQFLALGKSVSDEDLQTRITRVLPDDIFTIQYTSGTTGTPKGAMLTHAAYCMNSFAMANRQGLNPSDISCIPLPLFHAYGCLSFLAAVAAGASITVIERFNPGLLLNTIESCRATMVCGTPTMFVAALEELEQASYDLSSLRGGNMAGSPCPPDLVRNVCTRMGASEFGVLFGTTEALVSIMNTYSDSLKHRSETLGTAMPDFSIRVVDPVSGTDVKVGGQGEFYMKTPSMMTRYYQMPEKTAKAIDADGWYHSGDMVRANTDGYYMITGRIKDVIIRGGENIYPAAIEEFLITHPGILDAQVVGVPSSYYGEEAVAFIRLKPGEQITPLELKQYCRNHIAIDTVPANFFIVDTYPLTASGKVQKFKLREKAVEILSDS